MVLAVDFQWPCTAPMVLRLRSKERALGGHAPLRVWQAIYINSLASNSIRHTLQANIHAVRRAAVNWLIVILT